MPVDRLSEFGSQTTAVAIAPAPARSLDGAAAIQRLRYHKGRTLTAAALRLEAAGADVRFALTARVLADGVVSGFQIALADQAAAPGAFEIAPGYAISPLGQDIVLGRRIRLVLSDLPRGKASRPDEDAPLSGIAVLALEAISGEETRFTSAEDRAAAFRRDQQLDPGAAPYQDARVVDGLRLSVLQLDGLNVDPADADAMSRAIEALADAERKGLDLARFSARGVAIAMLGLGANGSILWAHRSGALRRGGGVEPAQAMPREGLRMPRRLRLARFDALTETLVAARRRAGGGLPDTDALRFLPPAGILPFAEGAEFNPFPKDWRTEVAPLPIGQIGAVMETCEALAGYDLQDAHDEVVVHVPVPDALFEPGLLETARVDQAFTDARETLRQRLSDALSAHSDLVKQVEVTEGLLDAGAIEAYVTAEDGAIDDEHQLPPPLNDPVTDHATPALELYTAWHEGLDGSTLLTEAQKAMLVPGGGAAGEPHGLVPFLENLQAGIDAADDFVDFGFTKVQAEIYRLRQVMLDNEEATKLATFPVLAGLAKGSNALATSRGLMENFARRKSAVAAAGAPGLVPDPDPVGGRFAGAMMVRSSPGDFDLAMSGFDRMAGLPGGPGRLADGTALTGALAGSAETRIGVDRDGGLTLTVEPSVSPPRRILDKSAAAAAAEKAAESSPYADVFLATRAIVTDEIALKGASNLRAGIAFASAIPGAYQDVRTLTIADRLAASIAQISRTGALRIKADTLKLAPGLGISLDRVKAPLIGIDAMGVILTRADFEAALAPFEADPEAKTFTEQIRQTVTSLHAGQGADTEVVLATFENISASDPLAAKVVASLRAGLTPFGDLDLSGYVLQRLFDPDPEQGTDEGTYLASAVAILESTVSVFRAVEGRVAALRGLLAGATETRNALEALAEAWREDLAAAARALAEARHDMLAFNALMAEETARINALNDRRRDVLRDHVKFVLFARPRRLGAHAAALTTGRMLPGVEDDPLPAALTRDAKLPEDLKQMLSVLREVPIAWFASADHLLATFRTPYRLDETFHWAANSAAIRINSRRTLRLTGSLAPHQGAGPVQRVDHRGRAGRSRKALDQLKGFYETLSERFLVTRQKVDLGRIARLDWQAKRRQAAEELSLNDLIDGNHDTESARRALQEVTGIERVLSSLHLLLRRVPPAVRLLWVDRLSVFDGDVDLGDPARLPGWSALTSAQRHDLRRLHGWLFARMAPGNAEARALISDVYQVAVLLAANAGTDEIVQARLAVEQTVSGGDEVELTVDIGQPEIDTPVWFDISAGKPVRGTIINIVSDRVRVKIEKTVKERVTLRAATPVFIDTRRRGRAGYGR